MQILNSDRIPSLSKKNELAATTDTDVTSAKPQERAFPQVANYEIVEEIASGGMGVVYKARQLPPNRLVAIKMIRAGSFASTKVIERFFTEAEAAAQFDDESVVPVYECGEVNGEPFFAMNYIDGENLDVLLSRDASTLEVACRGLSGCLACA